MPAIIYCLLHGSVSDIMIYRSNSMGNQMTVIHNDDHVWHSLLSMGNQMTVIHKQSEIDGVCPSTAVVACCQRVCCY